MIMDKVIRIKEIKPFRQELKRKAKRIVFTNGCFDIIHRGHIEYLKMARSLGDVLVIGVNSDSSVQKIKGERRPLVPLDDRLYILAQFPFVDFLIPFDEETPERIIKEVLPDVLVKGGDYEEAESVGADIVKAHGGEVRIIPYREGKSSSALIELILERHGYRKHDEDTGCRG
jgi:rfaE bifunctional protein nucleotidyltransferase chain/domain